MSSYLRETGRILAGLCRATWAVIPAFWRLVREDWWP